MTETKFGIMANGTTGVGRGLLQVDRELSKMNDMLFRQARNYSLRVGAWPGSTEENTYRIYTLPDTWFTHGAIKHAYNNWLKSIKDKAPVGAKFARWYDFRIEPMVGDGNSQLESCLAEMTDGGSTQVTWSLTFADEYAYSKTVDSGGTTKGLALGLATSSSEYDILDEYQKKITSAQPDAMTVTNSASYADLHDASDHVISDLLAESGDRAPYDYDRETIGDGVMPWVMKDTLTVDPDNGTTNSRTAFFTAPLGIVVIVKDHNQAESDFLTTQPELFVEVAKGNYKGVKSTPIVDFNPRKVEKTVGRA